MASSTRYKNTDEGGYEVSIFGIDSSNTILDQSTQEQAEDIYDSVSNASTISRPPIQPEEGEREKEGSVIDASSGNDFLVLCPSVTHSFAGDITFSSPTVHYFPNIRNVSVTYKRNNQHTVTIPLQIGQHRLQHFEEGPTTVSVTASDSNGRNATCQFTYTRLAAPFIICPSLQSKESGSITFDSPFLRNFPNPELVFISYSERGRVLLTLPATKGTHQLNEFKVGTTLMTAVASDSKLFASCDFYYTRLPVIQCPRSFSYIGTTASFRRSKTNFDAAAYYYSCDGKVFDVISSAASSTHYLEFFDRGETTEITASAVDNEGNGDFCTFNFTVTSSEGDRYGVRLVGGANPYEGRVEIYHDDVWGTVCDDNFDNNDAEVICSQLRYPDDNAVARSNAYFGRGSGQIWLDNVGCTGSESQLYQCPHNEWGTLRSCSHSEDAGVHCTNNGQYSTVLRSIRLVGGSNAHEGRVEVLYGSWGSVCDNYWSVEDAIVVCRQLGYPYGAVKHIADSHFGEGTGEIWMDRVQCVGTEDYLSQCAHYGWGYKSSSCLRHGDDAGVVCVDGTNFVRLVNGSSPFEGRVEILHNGVWGTVCSGSWNSTDALVVCRQLGFPHDDVEAPTDATFGEGTGNIWMDNVRCDVSDEQLSDCAYTAWGDHNCVHGSDAGVICK